MAIYAFLNDKNKVTKVEALNYNIESPYAIELQTYDPTLIGKIWDGTNFVEDTSVAYSNIHTKLKFRSKFTITELATIYQKIDAGDLTLKVIMDNFNVAEFVDIADQRTIDAINYLVYVGAITPERATEILTPIEE